MLKEPYEKILAKCHEIADDEKITDGWEAFSNLWDWLEQEAAQQRAQANCPTCGASLSSGTTPKDDKLHCPQCGQSNFLPVPHGQSCACDKCKHKAVYEFKPASRSH